MENKILDSNFVVGDRVTCLENESLSKATGIVNNLTFYSPQICVTLDRSGQSFRYWPFELLKDQQIRLFDDQLQELGIEVDNNWF